MINLNNCLININNYASVCHYKFKTDSENFLEKIDFLNKNNCTRCKLVFVINI